MAPRLSKSDNDVQTAIGAISDHLTTMRLAQRTAEDIKSRVGVVFNATSGQAFQRQISMWEDDLASVQRMFSTLQEDLNQSSLILNSANDDALGAANAGWGSAIGHTTFSALTPNN